MELLQLDGLAYIKNTLDKGGSTRCTNKGLLAWVEDRGTLAESLEPYIPPVEVHTREIPERVRRAAMSGAFLPHLEPPPGYIAGPQPGQWIPVPVAAPHSASNTGIQIGPQTTDQPGASDAHATDADSAAFPSPGPPNSDMDLEDTEPENGGPGSDKDSSISFGKRGASGQHPNERNKKRPKSSPSGSLKKAKDDLEERLRAEAMEAPMRPRLRGAHATTLSDLENVADRLFRAAIVDLFACLPRKGTTPRLHGTIDPKGAQPAWLHPSRLYTIAGHYLISQDDPDGHHYAVSFLRFFTRTEKVFLSTRGRGWQDMESRLEYFQLRLSLAPYLRDRLEFLLWTKWNSLGAVPVCRPDRVWGQNGGTLILKSKEEHHYSLRNRRDLPAGHDLVTIDPATTQELNELVGDTPPPGTVVSAGART